jgi:hypothetical protein
MTGIDAAGARRAAAAEDDPELLIGQDIIRYAEYLTREDHRVLAPDYQFWGGVADMFSYFASIPDRAGAQNPGTWSRFNAAARTAVGYIRMSGASQGTRVRLLSDYFPPPALSR